MAGVCVVLLCIMYINLLIHTTMAYGEHDVTGNQDKDCPLWTYPNNITGTCKCGDDLSGTIECNERGKTVSIKSCYCMTLDESTFQPVVSNCLYTCYTVYNDIRESRPFHWVGTNTTANLNNVTCGHYNRKGKSCWKCIEGHGLPVYSYSLSCVECSDYKYNWLKYIAVAYIPLTLFYFTVIIFRISATSGSMIGYVTVSQMVATYSLVKLYWSVAQNAHSYINILIMIYSIWNLDFFRSLYPPFCLHPKLTSLQVLMLDYLVAVYPMVLVFLTYIFVKFDERFRLTMYLCWPVYKCLRYFRKELDIKSSLISAFATMLLLSYVKILNVTANILSSGYHYDMYGNYGHLYVYYDTNTLYLSREHLPYFMTAIAMSLVFNIIPLLLLCMYPCRCFRICLNSTGFQCQVLHTFMDTFQGSYKHKPLNFRGFTALYFIAQIVNLTIYIVTGEQAYHPLSCYLLIFVVILLAIARPHKNKWHNVIDITLFTSVLISYMSVTFQFEGIYSSKISGNTIRYLFYGQIIFLPSFIPPMYGLLHFIIRTMPLKIKEAMIRVLKRVFSSSQQLEESLPQRLQECTPLINH